MPHAEGLTPLPSALLQRVPFNVALCCALPRVPVAAPGPGVPVGDVQCAGEQRSPHGHREWGCSSRPGAPSAAPSGGRPSKAPKLNSSAVFYKLSPPDGTGSTGAKETSSFSAQEKQVSGCALEWRPLPPTGEAHELLMSSKMDTPRSRSAVALKKLLN